MTIFSGSLEVIIRVATLLSCCLSSCFISYLVYLKYQCFSLRSQTSKRNLGPAPLPAHAPHKIAIPHESYHKQYGGPVQEIAVLTGSASTAYTESIATYLRENSSLVYHLDTYVTSGETRKNQMFMEEILQKNYKALVTIGVSALDAAVRMSVIRKKYIPIIFAATLDTAWHKLMAQYYPQHATGITGSDGSVKRIRMLIDLIPQMKKVLVFVHKNSYLMQSSLDNVNKTATARGVTLVFAKIATIEDALYAIHEHVGTIDAVMLTRVSLPAEKIAKLCNKHGIPLISEIVGAAHAGASLHIGITPVDMGLLVAERILKILEQGNRPTDVPVINIGNARSYEMIFNTHAMQQQNLSLDRFSYAAHTYGEKLYIESISFDTKLNGGV